ncbi:hypothetical protein VTO42DRAFT_2177 [Malbranchea cinnamomea]
MLPYIDLPFVSLSETTGASVDELKLVFSFLLSYPLAAILKRLPDSQPWKKNAFIVCVSVFYLVGLFDLWDGLRTLIYSSAGTYAIAYFVDGSLMPWLGFLFLMGHMSISHIARQIKDSPSSVDITGAQMVLVMKLTAFCWNVHDGRLPVNQLTPTQAYAAIREFPSLLDFAGYVFFFPSLWAGPACDYVEYRRWIETTMFDLPPGVDQSKAPLTRKKRRIPRSGRPAMRKAAMGLSWIAAFLVMGPRYNTDLMLSDKYMEYNIFLRVIILHLFGFTARLKYYGVWMLTEGACILSGMGYNGIDPHTGKVHWDKLENVNPWGLETAQSPHQYLANWNKNTNHWLRNYIYLRVTPKGKKPGFRASLATFITSAVWHGFYPGYYLTFVLGAFLQTSAKHFRRHIRPFFLSPTDPTKPARLKPYYDVLSWLGTQLLLSFAAAPFVVLRFRDCITVWARVYFYGIIGVALTTIAFGLQPVKKYLGQQLEARNRRALAATRGGAGAQQTAAAIEKGKEKAKKAQRQEEEREREGAGLALGLPGDLAGDIDEARREIQHEIDVRRRRGSAVTMPSGAELTRAGG